MHTPDSLLYPSLQTHPGIQGAKHIAPAGHGFVHSEYSSFGLSHFFAIK